MKYVKVLLILSAIVSLILSFLFIFAIKPIAGEPFINYTISLVLIYNAISACFDAKRID